MRPKAEAGDAEAQYVLGLIYEGGIGVEASPKDAYTWYEKAMNQGHAAATTAIGDLFFDGAPGVDPDPSMAAFWYLKAAEMGDGMAQAKMGYAYAIGLAVQQDTALAYYWLMRSVRVGTDSAQVLLERVQKAMDPEETARARELLKAAGIAVP